MKRVTATNHRADRLRAHAESLDAETRELRSKLDAATEHMDRDAREWPDQLTLGAGPLTPRPNH